MRDGLLRLDLKSKRTARPKYEQLKEHFIREIHAGRLKAGQALPSVKCLEETLGVAQMTVRQAMASLESEGLIRRVARRGNFVDVDARRKLKRGLDIFALVVPETREAFYPSLLHGFQAATAAIYYQTIICNTDDNVERQSDIILQLIDKKVGGVAINPTSPQPTPPHQIRQIQEHGIPVVLCHRGVKGIMAPLLAIPFHEVGHMAGRLLVEHGHRRAVFVTCGGPQPAHAYEDGFREGLQSGGSDVSVEVVYVEERPIKRRQESCRAALQQVFAQPDPPTCIFATFDSIATIIYLLLPQLGLRVPEDVSLVGFGGAWREEALIQRLTSVVIDEIATGRQAVSLLHEMRCGNRDIDNNQEFELELGVSQGETLAKVARPIL